MMVAEPAEDSVAEAAAAAAAAEEPSISEGDEAVEEEASGGGDVETEVVAEEGEGKEGEKNEEEKEEEEEVDPMAEVKQQIKVREYCGTSCEHATCQLGYTAHTGVHVQQRYSIRGDHTTAQQHSGRVFAATSSCESFCLECNVLHDAAGEAGPCGEKVAKRLMLSIFSRNEREKIKISCEIFPNPVRATLQQYHGVGGGGGAYSLFCMP